MDILIVGCGKVGATLARALEQNGHGVSVVDHDPANLEHLYEYGHSGFHGTTVCGVPIDVDVLKSAGIAGCDAVLAVTQEDSVNIMVAQVAQELYGVKNVIARIYDPAVKEVFANQFSICALSPTTLTVQAVLSSLLQDEQSHTMTFGSDSFAFHLLPVTKRQIGHTLSEIPQPDGQLIFGILRENTNVDLARPELIIKKNDSLILSRSIDHV